jgi:CYTH domain-containing protein
MEYSWRVVAEENAAKALILDRGILDGAAYMPGGLPAFIKRFDLDLEKAYSRYDMVIHLETIARSRPYLFGKGGNECRYETNPEDAVELDLKIQEAWKGHPNWHFIPGNMELEDVVAQVLDLIGEMVSWEIEKKYLLNSKVIWPCSEGIEVIQGYLLSPDMEGAELRIRRFGNNRHFMTTKSRANLKRREWERKIVKAEFESLWPATKDRRISKTRFYVPHGNYTLELDQYHGLHEGLLLLECEFKKEEEIADFHLPDWTGHAIDVTDDPQYKNLWLAEHGLPK